MNFLTRHSPAFDPSDDDLAAPPDAADRAVLTAMRVWLRPDCEAAQNCPHWRSVLTSIGMRTEGIEHFDLLMRSLLHVSARPLDTRCQCVRDLAKDEASILQTIALLQKTHSGAAVRLLAEWLPAPAVSGVLKLMRWFAIDLLDAGLEIRVQNRRVTYMH